MSSRASLSEAHKFRKLFPHSGFDQRKKFCKRQKKKKKRYHPAKTDEKKIKQKKKFCWGVRPFYMLRVA